MMLMYPKDTVLVTKLFERILDHLLGVLYEQKAYEETLHDLLRDFHDKEFTSIADVKIAVQTQNAAGAQ